MGGKKAIRPPSTANNANVTRERTDGELNDDEMAKESRQRVVSFNGMTASEWAAASRNVWNDVSSPRTTAQLAHGATFPEKLAARLITIYSREGDLVLDPFVGTGTTLVACKHAGRGGIGIELNEHFHALATEAIASASLEGGSRGSPIRLIHDDCRNVLDHVNQDSIQLMITSPPYANFIQKAEEDRKKVHKNSIISKENNSRIKRYSESPDDFGNLDYKAFLEHVKDLMKKLLVVTKPGGYNAWIVKDARDTKRGIPYVPFHLDFARLGEEAGFKFHDLIIWDQNEQRRLVLLGYPSVFYTNQNCSFIVVLRKPG